MDARMHLQEDPFFESILGIKQRAAQVMPLVARPAIAQTCTIFKALLNGYEVLLEDNQFFTHA